MDRVEFDKRAVVEFLDDRVIVTNEPSDRTTAYEMFQLFKSWWTQYTNRSIVDLYEFNQYAREELPGHCCCKRSFVGIRFGNKTDKDNDDPKRMIACTCNLCMARSLKLFPTDDEH